MPCGIPREAFSRRKYANVEAFWRLTPSVEHRETLIGESMYMLRPSVDWRQLPGCEITVCANKVNN
jgi:hypothetical protein